MAVPGKIKSSKVAFASSKSKLSLSSNSRQVLHGRLEPASAIIVSGLDHDIQRVFSAQEFFFSNVLSDQWIQVVGSQLRARSLL